MASLKAFLNPITPEEKEVIVSVRFQEDGNPVPFRIRALTQKENEQLVKKHTRVDKKTGNEIFNRINYNHDMVASAVVFPDLTDAQLQKAYNVAGEIELLKNMLLIGEFVTLAAEVQELSGLDKDINDDIEDVKNG